MVLAWKSLFRQEPPRPLLIDSLRRVSRCRSSRRSLTAHKRRTNRWIAYDEFNPIYSATRRLTLRCAAIGPASVSDSRTEIADPVAVDLAVAGLFAAPKP